jgi:Asp-tRNA(Asn)/Glu-tRNA(Gln) amidotransferase C subunit
MFLKKMHSGGILAMKVGTSAKITVGAIGLLAILIAGFISFRALTQSPKEESHNVLKQAGQTEIARERQGSKLLSQENRRQVKSSQKPLASSSAENTEISDEEIDRIIEFFEKLESSEVAKVPSIEEISEYDQANAAKSYDERYDMLIEICQQMETILDRISQINDELMRRKDEVIHLVEVKSKVGYLTEDEMSIIKELQPMVKEYETLNAEHATLPGKVNDIIPGAVKTETFDMPDTLPDVVKDVIPEAAKIKIDLPDTITMTHINYKYIKSMLGSVPEELDAYLSQFLNAGWGKSQ